MSKRHTALAGSLLVTSLTNGAPHDRIEEVVVTATPFGDAISESLLPVDVLAGEKLRRNVANSLGDTLDNLPGVQSASFGPGVGQPVIRGQSGKRVQVLQSGVGVTDASAISPDHAIGVDPLLADRIEVLRGPSTLLYGNGAIGGVVNVIDNRIPESTTSEHLLVAEHSYDTALDQNKTVVRLDAAADTLAFHFDAVTRENGVVDIPGYAVDVAALEALEALEGHEEDHDEEVPNTRGFIGNSDGEGESVHAGLSAIRELGFLGFSAGRTTRNYGLPPGVHAHHEEEPEEEEHADDPRIRLDMEKVRYDLKGLLNVDRGIIESARASLAWTDYEHREMEFEGDSVEVGTIYTNRGFDGRMTVEHAPIGNVAGVWGLQLGNTTFSAVGEEAFIPRSDVDSAAVFLVERIGAGAFDWELGVRYERRTIDPEGNCETNDSSTSVSASMLYDITSDSNVLVALSRSERTPTVEELYSNVTAAGCTRAGDAELVMHAATGLLEVGDPALGNEVARNIELGYRHFGDRAEVHLSAFYNRIDDYIWLDKAGEIEEQTIALYQGRDARFTGLEGEVTLPVVELGSGHLEASLTGDLVRAEFEDGTHVPRIPAGRLGAGFAWHQPKWSLDVKATRVFDQSRVAPDELETDGYTVVTAWADYHWALSDRSELMVYLRGDNLLDEEIRNHASLLKHFAPQPGRSFRVGIRFSY